jgi:uncharacterized membrane protein YgdD (TMEM256/DUF423 family)
MPTALIAALAGLVGVAGVAGAAYASHGGDPRLLGIAAGMTLLHAPALLALAAFASRVGLVSLLTAALWVVGLALFGGDLVSRAVSGARLFASAAPAGGLLLMAGWLSLVPLGWISARRQ